jgi:hypothetical protein
VPIRFELGERVLIPAYSPPSEAMPGEPSSRPLWIYASDPASFGLRQPVLKVEVPYEQLKPGLEGRLFKVAPGALPPDLVKQLDWGENKATKFATELFDLESRLMLVQGGLRPTTGDPRFAGQMVYAVCHQVWRTFARALGRNPTWGPWLLRRRAAKQPAQLLIKPFSQQEANAYYDRNEGSIGFGYFRAWPTDSEFVLPEGMIFAALSRDVIAHEMTHALLDGMRAEFMRDTHPDVRAFHEAFADIVALLHNFAQPELVEQALEEKGDLNADSLLGLGRQIGEATNGSAGGAMRRALTSGERRDRPIDESRRYVEDKPQEEHERGSVLVAAIFEAFLDAYEARAKLLLRLARGGGMDKTGVLPAPLTQLLAKEVRKLADQFLNICIRAIDYCPPVDIRFGEYLRAMLTADSDVVPDDGHGYRDKLIKSFRRRNIKIDHVLDLSQDSLRWGGPDPPPSTPIMGLRFRDLDFEDDSLRHAGEKELRRRAEVLGEFVTRDAGALRHYGLHPPGGEYGPIIMQSIRLLYRVDAGGFGRNDLIAEITQTRTKDRSEFVGGATLIIGADGRLRYTVYKRVDDIRRRKRELAYAGPGGAKPLDLRQLHRLPPRQPSRASR